MGGGPKPHAWRAGSPEVGSRGAKMRSGCIVHTTTTTTITTTAGAFHVGARALLAVVVVPAAVSFAAVAAVLWIWF